MKQALDIAEQLQMIMPTALTGSVSRMVGLVVAANGFPAPLGSVAHIMREAADPVRAEVIGFKNGMTLLYPHDDPVGIRHGNRIQLVRTSRWIRTGDSLLGRVIDTEGRFVDGGPKPLLKDRVPVERKPPHACRRPNIDTPLSTGVRTIDGLLTCGRGQRLGIFAGSGVGKSTLLGMMARYTSADVIVIGLVGERGRELNEFIQRDLGPEGLKKSVVVVATSDEPALSRVRAASTATAIAEYYRDQGKDVLLLMDSITRFAMAQREIGLAAGEPPTSRGYPPSVFMMLPKLVERAGRGPTGSITAFYTVLVEGDDINEPIADAVRGLLDGHVWLSRDLADRGHFPAIDLLGSISRLAPNLVDRQQTQATYTIRELLSAYRDNEDMIIVGAYRRGSNAKVDAAIDLQDAIAQYMRQAVDEPSTINESRDQLLALASAAAAKIGAGSQNGQTAQSASDRLAAAQQLQAQQLQAQTQGATAK